jgi:hypothetical protein
MSVWQDTQQFQKAQSSQVTGEAPSLTPQKMEIIRRVAGRAQSPAHCSPAGSLDLEARRPFWASPACSPGCASWHLQTGNAVLFDNKLMQEHLISAIASKGCHGGCQGALGTISLISSLGRVRTTLAAEPSQAGLSGRKSQRTSKALPDTKHGAEIKDVSMLLRGTVSCKPRCGGKSRPGTLQKPTRMRRPPHHTTPYPHPRARTTGIELRANQGSSPVSRWLGPAHSEPGFSIRTL